MGNERYRKFLYRLTRMPCTGLFLFLFLGGFLAGILFANLAWSFHNSALTGLNLLSSASWVTVEGRPENYLKYLAGVRLKAPLLLAALGFTTCGTIAVCLALLWYGFLGGLLCSAALLQMGVKGMLLLFAGMLLPAAVYAPALVLLLNQVFLMSEELTQKPAGEGREYGAYSLACAVLLAVFGLGLLVECYVNPVVMGLLGRLL